MRLLLDECVSPRVARALLDAGLDAQHVRALGMLGKSDRLIWSYASTNICCVLSHDSDFLELATKMPYGGAKLIWFQQANLGWQAVSDRLIAHKDDLFAFAADEQMRVLELR